jgi:hypothetical protein
MTKEGVAPIRRHPIFLLRGPDFDEEEGGRLRAFSLNFDATACTGHD